jgi:hemerythrin-like domain-containing protein
MTTPGNYETRTADMIAVHRALTDALDAAPTLIGDAGGDPDRVAVIGSFYDNVLEFLHVHHAGEDELIYPVLEERCTDSTSLLERIDAQHALLNEPMTITSQAIATWKGSPSVETGRAAVNAVALVDDTLRPHLEEEETMVLPIASAWMSPEEWAELPGHALRSFRGDKPWLALGLVRQELAQEERDAMLARMPPEMQALWTEEWEPAYDAFIAEVHS